MKGCTYGVTLEELLERPMGHLALRGSDGDSGQGEPDAGAGDEGDKGAKPGDADEDDKSGDDDGKDGEKPDANERRIKNLEEEKDRHLAKRREAEAEVKKRDAEIAKLKKDGTPDDALKTENATLTTENESLREANRTLMLQNAFLAEKGFDWVDPEAAMRLADLSEVEFDDKQNKAIGLNSALAKLAKAKPYLLKKAESGDDKDDKGKPAASGRTPRGGKTNDADEIARKAKLQAKYPGLRR